MKKHLIVAMISAVFLLAAQSALARPEMGLRVSLGIVPGVDTYEESNSLGSAKLALDSEAGVNFNPAFVIRTGVDNPVGFVGTIGPIIRTHVGKDSIGGKGELTVFGVSAQPGLAVKLSETIHLEFKGELGLGAANQSIPGATDGSGPYVSIGATAGAYFRLGETFVLGGDFGFLQFTSTGEIDYGGGLVYDTEFEGSGPFANVSVGWMF